MSLASHFSMIGLNRLIHNLTQALPNMKLKKVMPGLPQALYYYQSSPR